MVGAGAGPGKERKVRSDVLYLFREMSIGLKIRQNWGLDWSLECLQGSDEAFLSSGLTVALENLVQYPAVMRCPIEAAVQAAVTKRRHRL